MSEESTQTNSNEQDSALEQILSNPELVAQLKEALVPNEAPEISKDEVKATLNKAYGERDDALKQIAELQEKQRQAELRALEEAGKKEEADKLRMEELARQLKESQERVTTLTRDNALRSELASLDFKSDKAADVAYKDIVGSLIQDAAGNWVSPTGQSISDYTKFYAADESNSFLFNVKQSSGSSTMATKSTSTPVSQTKSLKDMTTAELLEAAERGDFDAGKNWM